MKEAHHLIMSKVDQKYEDAFLQVSTKGSFTKGDIESNDIMDMDEGEVPRFVKKHQEMLGQK